MVSAIIPARNEEISIARTVESVAAQPEIGEVIVVDDGSTDRTAAILEDLKAQLPKLKVVSGGPLPVGWVGKNHAVAVGAAAATGNWLLFTDADTQHLPGATMRALADAAERHAVLVSYSPEQEMETWWERAIIPFVYCRLAERFSFARVNDSSMPDAAANGQFILMLREVYETVGGHGAVRGEILEDVALARCVKKEGFRIYFSAPKGAIRTRMYRSFGAMWEGWTKNLYLLIGRKPRAVTEELAEATPLFDLFVLISFLVLGWHRGNVEWLWVGEGVLAMLILRMSLFGASLSKNLYPLSFIEYYVPGALLYSAILLVSWWKNFRGFVAWKGRTYPVGSRSASRSAP